MKSPASLYLVAGMTWATAATADPIDTNRPGFTFTTGVVEPGRWQLETGLSLDRVDSDADVWSLPLAEIRFGLASNIEGFVSSMSWTEADVGSMSFSGMTDWATGIKANVTPSDAVTQMAVLLQVGVPVGDDRFTSDRWDPSAAFIWQYQGDLQLAGTLKLSDFSQGYQVDNSVKLPFSLGGPHSTFVEWEANLPEVGDDTHYFTAAYQYLLRENIQLDVNGSVGLNGAASDYRLGIGFSIRP